ncbi:MAG: hypothetical protein J6K29_04885 [Clostridia bacterium]|nr:hypothetical protein [Clostridia bacterium]
MKEKYTKPEINIMLKIVIENDDDVSFGNDDDGGISFNAIISGGTVPGQGGSDL